MLVAEKKKKKNPPRYPNNFSKVSISPWSWLKEHPPSPDRKPRNADGICSFHFFSSPPETYDHPIVFITPAKQVCRSWLAVCCQDTTHAHAHLFSKVILHQHRAVHEQGTDKVSRHWLCRTNQCGQNFQEGVTSWMCSSLSCF